MAIERRIDWDRTGDDHLQLPILVLGLLELTDIEAAVLRLPAVVGSLANPLVAAYIGDRLARLGELDDADDLSFGQFTRRTSGRCRRDR